MCRGHRWTEISPRSLYTILGLLRSLQYDINVRAIYLADRDLILSDGLCLKYTLHNENQRMQAYPKLRPSPILLCHFCSPHCATCVSGCGALLCGCVNLALCTRTQCYNKAMTLMQQTNETAATPMGAEASPPSVTSLPSMTSSATMASPIEAARVAQTVVWRPHFRRINRFCHRRRVGRAHCVGGHALYPRHLRLPRTARCGIRRF